MAGGETIADVLVIGAGPCGLAVAARLCEPVPSALYSDAEHARFHWLKKHDRSGLSLLRTSNDGTARYRHFEANVRDPTYPSGTVQPFDTRSRRDRTHVACQVELAL